MDHILDIAARHNVAVVEDNAHGLFAKYRGRSLGTFGCLATQSFHETKNFNCGEGGALLINDPEYVERAEIIHEKGTDRTRFLRGQVDKYTWIDLGSSYLPSELQAAYLLAQMEMRDEIQEKRQNLWQSYYHHLNEWATANAVGLPIVPPHCLQAYHMFYLMMPSAQARAALSAHLAARDIVAASHYVPLHLSPMGMASGGRRGDCPVTENVSDRLLRLPLYYDLTESDLARIVDAVTQSSVASVRSS
jgi:dTDP-4-amino-4,6-dideoxygalactose transaminase